VCVTLSDGSSFFLLDEVRIVEGVFAGREIGPQERERLERISEVRAATQSALLLLARAPHTRSGLRLKLLKRGFGPAAADAALGRADELGYLDDAGFAEAWIEIRLERHPEGRAALIAGLRERGVPREVAAEVVERVVTDEREEECLLRALVRGRRRKGAAGAEAARMRALGFPYKLVRRHLPDGAGQESP
jgi:regulatory protein